MKKNKKLNNELMIEKYKKQLEENPQSKSFAPLADCYRKSGQFKEAFLVLKKGLKIYPRYELGLYVLAHCYFDKKNYEIVYEILSPIADKNLDNFLMQKIFAYSCLYLNHIELSFQKFKYLLYLRPNDAEIQKIVKDLEEKCDGNWTEKAIWMSFKKDIEPNENAKLTEHNWKVSSLNQNENRLFDSENSFDHWNISNNKNYDAFFSEIKDNETKKINYLFEPQAFDIDLIDAYINKKLYKQALETLESYHSLGESNPLVDQKILVVRKLISESNLQGIEADTKNTKSKEKTQDSELETNIDAGDCLNQVSLKKVAYLEKLVKFYTLKLN